MAKLVKKNLFEYKDEIYEQIGDTENAYIFKSVKYNRYLIATKELEVVTTMYVKGTVEFE